ncbi:hypothetical protein [Serratia sp. UGAL515B_01]|uniref:hypothetical protein n=1 Tax=Serratia sp. UGAL515B_01 TaxID=2986763 RepID=UPI0029548414|nr:hypothetical protein [Serratia sp. UGAL515B_01]WON76450.1 hypothetical protein OK023_14705 [Serratia sp. UGAL515B_01]
MKVKFFFLALLTVILIISLLFFFIKKPMNQESKLCLSTAKFKVENGNNLLTYTISYRLFFRGGNGVGYAAMRGVVMKNETEYVLARNVAFNYFDQNGTNHFEAKINEMTKTGQDSVPDLLIEKYFPYTMPDKKSYFRIDEISQGRFLISANQGPFLICSGAIQ